MIENKSKPSIKHQKRKEKEKGEESLQFSSSIDGRKYLVYAISLFSYNLFLSSTAAEHSFFPFVGDTPAQPCWAAQERVVRRRHGRGEGGTAADGGAREKQKGLPIGEADAGAAIFAGRGGGLVR